VGDAYSPFRLSRQLAQALGSGRRAGGLAVHALGTDQATTDTTLVSVLQSGGDHGPGHAVVQ